MSRLHGTWQEQMVLFWSSSSHMTLLTFYRICRNIQICDFWDSKLGMVAYQRQSTMRESCFASFATVIQWALNVYSAGFDFTLGLFSFGSLVLHRSGWYKVCKQTQPLRKMYTRVSVLVDCLKSQRRCGNMSRCIFMQSTKGITLSPQRQRKQQWLCWLLW